MAGPSDHDAARSTYRGRAHRWRIVLWGAIFSLVLLPAVAMQVTDEVAWTVSDFVFAAVMLSGAGLAWELVLRRPRPTAYRAASALAIVAALLLVWTTGAVGIIGAEDHAANLLYGGVLAVVFIGTLVTRFRPAGMARAMFAAAIVQASIAAAALLAGWGSEVPGWQLDILGATAMFVALWGAAGWLFRRASRDAATATIAFADPGA